MIIIISGQQGSGKTQFANQLAKSVFPQTPADPTELPKSKPKYLSPLLTIYTHQKGTDIPKWILGRKDYTVIYLDTLLVKNDTTDQPECNGNCGMTYCDKIEFLKECNLKLDALRTADYRFVAWIIYSTQHSCFVAGVDTYSNDEQNLQYVVAKAIDASPTAAMNQVYRQICEWEAAGEVPVLSELFS